MKNHVTSLELSKRMKELGFPQKSECFWSTEDGEGRHIIVNPCMPNRYVDYSAYLASELGEWLPSKMGIKGHREWLQIIKLGQGYITQYWKILQCNAEYTSYKENEIHSMPDSMAKMLIHLAEQKIMVMSYE